MNFSALILAGGRSRRMGRDKALLEYEGQPLLARQIALAKACGATEVFVSGRAEGDYARFGCPVLLDAWPDCGPLSGIERGLEAASHNLLLLLAVDLPLLRTSLLQQLLSACMERTGAVPQFEERLEPLAAIYPKMAHPLARKRLEAKQFSACAFAEACLRNRLVTLFRVSAGVKDFTNWNSPEALALSGNVCPPHGA